MAATRRARSLRRNQTEAEAKLWQALRAGRLGGFKFRRQVSLGLYFADLVCPARKLIVEVDGGQHTAEVDAVRTAYLESQGYRIVRFWNNEVLANIEGVALVIRGVLEGPLPPTREERAGPSLPRRRGGEVPC